MTDPSRGFHVDHSIATLEGAVGELRRRSLEPSQPWRAQVLVVPARLSALVIVVGPKDADGIASAISMAPSTRFTASRAISPRPLSLEISALSEATVDEDLNVELADGRCIYNVLLQPDEYFRELTEVEQHGVWATLSFMDGDRRAKNRNKLYSTAEIPKLEAIERYVRDRVAKNPRLKSMSRETIRRALMKSGLWQPGSRRRAGPDCLSFRLDTIPPYWTLQDFSGRDDPPA